MPVINPESQKKATRRTRTTVIIMVLAPIAWEFWRYFRDPRPLTVNPWFALDYPIDLEWYLKDLGERLYVFLSSIAFYRSSRNVMPVRVACVYLLLLSFVNLVFFFINYNRWDYTLVYYVAGVTTLYISFNFNGFEEWMRGVGNKWYEAVDWFSEKRYKLRKKINLWKSKNRLKSVPVETFLKKQTIDV